MGPFIVKQSTVEMRNSRKKSKANSTHNKFDSNIYMLPFCSLLTECKHYECAIVYVSSRLTMIYIQKKNQNAIAKIVAPTYVDYYIRQKGYGCK